MRKFIISCLCFMFLFVQRATGENEPAKEPTEKSTRPQAICVLGKKVESFPFYVYQDGNSTEQNFFASGFMGDLTNIDLDLYHKNKPYKGTSCVKITYKKTADSLGWGGLYWQFPANNWGDEPTGYDLQLANKLTFWARGENGGEVITVAQVGGIAGKYGDTCRSAVGPITLSKEWKQYTINLIGLDYEIMFSKESRDCWPFMEPLSRVVGGFGWAASSEANQKQGITFYLDEIRFEGD